MSKNLDKKLSSNLEKLGLSSKEIDIYLYLIQRTQEVGTSKIIQGTGLHGQYVYNALDSLEKKGLVKHATKNGRKKWSSNPPNRIESLVEEKRIVAQQVKLALEQLCVKPNEQEFEVFQGEEQFITSEFNMIQEAQQDSTILIIGGKGDKFSEMLGDQRKEYNEKSLNKNIKVMYVGSFDQNEYLTWVKSVRKNFEFRIMPGLHSSSVGISIHDDAILFHVYGIPLLVFKIKSKEIADNYRTFFDSLWNMLS